MTDLAIRTLAEADLDQALAINEAAVPAVNSRDRETLASYLRQSVAAPAGYDGETLAGFLICVGENADYESVNYDWISGTFDTFAYVDRIAIAEAYRNRGLGQRLYDAAIAEIDRRHVRLVCEVNREPPNPGSERFHKRLGFDEVGERWSDDRAKGVVYLARPLT
ncbi:MAG: GNAT family N-acetyltransferase [Pseudomonadota bacterium]